MGLGDYKNFVEWRWGFQTWRLRYKVLFVLLLVTGLLPRSKA